MYNLKVCHQCSTVRNHSQCESTPEILGKFASVIGLISASLYYTGWIYRWAYYNFFQIDLSTLELSFESFLIVPIQVLFGNIYLSMMTLCLIMFLFLMINVTLWIFGIAKLKTRNILSNYASLRSSLREQSPYKTQALKRFVLVVSMVRQRQSSALRALCKEAVIIIWILSGLFLIAKNQGFYDARRDALSSTSTLPIVAVLASDNYLPVGRNTNDPSIVSEGRKKLRFVGEISLARKLLNEGYNDRLDKTDARVWRLLLKNRGWIYIFRTISKKADRYQRPLVLALKEDDSGQPFVLTSPEIAVPPAN